MTEVCWPPVFRVGHQRREVSLHRVEVERCVLCGVVEVWIHWIGCSRVLIEDLQIELVGPPHSIRRVAHHVLGLIVKYRALLFVGHDTPTCLTLRVIAGCSPKRGGYEVARAGSRSLTHAAQ